MSAMGSQTIEAYWLGRIPYLVGYQLQEELVEEVAAGSCPGVLLLLEHDPVITLGRSSKSQHLLVDRHRLQELSVELYETNRGGSVTYHGPGQLVGYPILPVQAFGSDLHRYLRLLESVLLNTLERFGVSGGRVAGLTGVWVNGRKIAAIGVGVRRFVTMHGFALNVSTDLAYFDLIVPCGITNYGVTSLERELGRAIPLDDVAVAVAEAFSEIFGLKLVWARAPRAEAGLGTR